MGFEEGCELLLNLSYEQEVFLLELLGTLLSNQNGQTSFMSEGPRVSCSVVLFAYVVM